MIGAGRQSRLPPLLQDPIQANQEQVQAEAAAVAGVAGSSCPVQAVLDRLVITSTGVIVACWQVSMELMSE